MRLKVFYVVAMLIMLAPPPTQACPSDSGQDEHGFHLPHTVPTLVFESTVTTRTDQYATLKVDKAVTGTKTGDLFTIEQGHASGDLFYEKGTRWSFSGQKPETGNRIAGDFKMIPVSEDTGNNEQVLLSGTAQASCAPWDGAAFNIKLDNGIQATIYDSLPSDAVISETKIYRLGSGHMQQNGGQLLIDCDSSAQSCKTPEGIFSILSTSQDTITGLIEIPSTGARHMFRVRYDRRDKALCG